MTRQSRLAEDYAANAWLVWHGDLQATRTANAAQWIVNYWNRKGGAKTEKGATDNRLATYVVNVHAMRNAKERESN